MREKLAIRILFLIAEFLADNEALKKEIRAVANSFAVNT